MKIGEIHFTGNEDCGVCWHCGGELPKHRRRWCSDDCRDKYWERWNWRRASLACWRRANHCCENCRKNEEHRWEKEQISLEVHHIIAIGGGDRSWHKLNGPHNLICLCHNCHLEVHRIMDASEGAKPQSMDPWDYAEIVGQGVFKLKI